MGLGARIRQLFAKTDTTPVDPRRGNGFYVPWSWIPDGLRLSEHEALQVGVVYACVRIISQVIAGAPWNVVAVTDGKRKKLPDDPLAYIFNTRLNQDSPAQSAKEGLLAQSLIWGNAYAEIEKDGAGRVIGIWPLMSDRMLPPTRETPDGELIYEYMNVLAPRVKIPASRILHFRGVSIDGLVGLGTVQMASRSIAHAAAVEKYGLSYFANSATPSGALMSPKPLGVAEREALRAEFASKYSGDRKAGMPLVLANGTTWQPISSDPAKSQLAETRPQTVEEMARWFGVPLHLLADPKGAQGYGRNLGELGLEFVRFTLAPVCNGIEQECEFKLLPIRAPKVIDIDLSHVSLGNAKERAETDEIRIRSGVMTPNEAREAAGLNHGDDDLDEHFILTTMQTVEKAVEPTPVPGEGTAPNEADDQETDQPAADPMLNQALVTMVAQSLERMDRRLKRKGEELDRRKIPTEARAEVMRAERDKQIRVLLEDCAPALGIIRKVADRNGKHLNGEADRALLAIVDELAKGKRPEPAARAFVDSLLPMETV